MNFEKRHINTFIYFICSLSVYVTLSVCLSFYFDLTRHWTDIYDQELTLAYNALLFNNGILQEFIVHSGYFTILFLSILIKLLHFLDLTEIYNLRTLLDYDNIDNPLQSIITISRIYSGVSVAIWCLAVNLLFYLISRSKLFSFILTLILFFLPGTVFHIYQLRTELYASFFMVLSFVMIISFLSAQKDEDYIKKIILFFIFIFCAILNKSQVFFFLFGIISLSLFFHTKLYEIKINIFNNINSKKLLFYIYSIIFIYLLFKINLFDGTYKSIIFNVLNLSIFNFLFYILTKRSKINPLRFLININLLLILSFVTLKLILFIHPSTNEAAFINTIIDIMGVARYTVDLSSAEISIVNFINIIFFNLEKVYLHYFQSINFFTILFFLILIMNLLYKKKIGTKFFYFNLLCIFMPLIFSFISSFREIQIVYNIFWDFILLLPLCVFYTKINIMYM